MLEACYNLEGFSYKFYYFSITIELNVLTVDIDPSSAVRVRYSFKNVQFTEVILYNLRHYASSYFCHFSARLILNIILSDDTRTKEEEEET
jgi:hypothetical protein